MRSWIVSSSQPHKGTWGFGFVVYQCLVYLRPVTDPLHPTSTGSSQRGSLESTQSRLEYIFSLSLSTQWNIIAGQIKARISHEIEPGCHLSWNLHLTGVTCPCSNCRSTVICFPMNYFINFAFLKEERSELSPTLLSGNQVIYINCRMHWRNLAAWLGGVFPLYSLVAEGKACYFKSQFLHNHTWGQVQGLTGTRTKCLSSVSSRMGCVVFATHRSDWHVHSSV